MENFFYIDKIYKYSDFPLQDNMSAREWIRYEEEVNNGESIISVLRKHLINLRFPIREGISTGDEYKAAIRKGIYPKKEDPFNLTLDENIKLYIYQTIVGKVPILEFKEDKDFENMVQALAYKNEHKVIPKSMGACLIKGYNNWSRIDTLKEVCKKENKIWREEFQKIKKNKELYQDNILLLSNKFYSNISNLTFGLDEKTWRDYSLIIRREHEVTHFITLMLFKSARNNIHDEIIADYMGIVSAFGEYKSKYFLTFLGMGNYPRYCKGGRLENYLDNYSDYIEMIKLASDNIEKLCKEYGQDIYTKEGSYKMLCALVKTNVMDMAYYYEKLKRNFLQFNIM